MHEISDISTDPSIPWIKTEGIRNAIRTRKGLPVRYEATGVRDGINILTILEPGGEGIISGYPIGF